jgi:hypothetical protein
LSKSIVAAIISTSLIFSLSAVRAEEKASIRMSKTEVHNTLEEIRAKVNKKSGEIDIAGCVKPDAEAPVVLAQAAPVETKPAVEIAAVETPAVEVPAAEKPAAEVKKTEPPPAAPAAVSSPMAISGYAQIVHTVSDVPASSHTFNLARARFVFKRKLDEDLSFFSQFNVAGNNADGSKLTLTDLFLQQNIGKAQNMMLGQFVVPSNYETMAAPRDVYMINYGQHIINPEHENVGNDIRDMGLMYNYRKKEDNWGVSVAVVNGEGINAQNDTNDAKMTLARLEFEPDPALKLGLYAADGKRFKAAATAAQIAFYGADGAATAARSFDRKRAGFDIRYKKEKLTLQGVFEALETGLAGRATNLKGKGAFVQAGYFVLPKLEMTLKYDVFNPNINKTATERKVNAAGFNWFIKKGTKMQMVYQKQKETPEVKNDRFDTLVTVEF